MKLYQKLKKAWWARPENQFCKGPFCRQKATELHHKFGRVGLLLNITALWIPLCRSCHAMVHDAPAWGIAKGLLAPKGQWNTIPKELK